jgi:hypothetical protein
MSWRTSLAGLLAGLSFISAALAQPGPWTVARVLAVAAGVLVAVLGVAATDAGRAIDPPQPDRSPVGPSDVILQRVRRGELSPDEGARALEAGRERRPVDVVSFEDAGRAAQQQPNARGDK